MGRWVVGEDGAVGVGAFSTTSQAVRTMLEASRNETEARAAHRSGLPGRAQEAPFAMLHYRSGSAITAAEDASSSHTSVAGGATVTLNTRDGRSGWLEESYWQRSSRPFSGPCPGRLVDGHAHLGQRGVEIPEGGPEGAANRATMALMSG